MTPVCGAFRGKPFPALGELDVFAFAAAGFWADAFAAFFFAGFFAAFWAIGFCSVLWTLGCLRLTTTYVPCASYVLGDPQENAPT